MNIRKLALVCWIITPFGAMAATEGTPTYYQNKPQTVNQANYGYYQNQGYSQYVGQSGQKQVVGQRQYSYQVPKPAQTPSMYDGVMTVNGIDMPTENQSATTLWAEYTRRFANFQFETGVNSILAWNSMIFNEIGIGAQHVFELRKFDLFAYGEYSMGTMSSGGLSMDYDLKPYNEADPHVGIFTISMGDMSGSTNHLRLGFGAHHIWDIAGWKLSPSIGYEIFKHNLEMSNHIYPNPGIYLPLMTDKGDYVFGDVEGNYYTIPVGATAPDDYYQVCMSPLSVINGK